MQYTALFFAALSAASALPGPRKAHHHHRRSPEADAAAYDVSNVNWAEALANVDWSTVKYDSDQDTTSTRTATTTVAVVGAATPAVAPTTTFATRENAVTSAPAVVQTSSTPVAVTTPVSVGNVAVPAQSSTSTSSVPATSTVASSASGDEYTVEVINNCAYTIWQAGWQTNTAGGLISSAVKGNELSAGASISLSIPKSAMGVQIWPRTGCTGSGSSFHCDVGDCQGFQCTSIIWQNGPIMAEFGSGLNTDVYNTDITAYDISVIPGNNCGAKIVPSISSCETKLCPLSGCSTSQAWQSAGDTALGSPADTTCSNEANFTVTFCPA